MPSKKHLIEWVMSHIGWSQGNNLAETRLIVRYYSEEHGVYLHADTLCCNGLGSTFDTERWLKTECPPCFVHLFKTKDVLVFDI